MNVLVCGAGGFIGSHLVKKLKSRGHFVIGADLKYPDFWETEADEFYIYDLKEFDKCEDLFLRYKPTQTFQLAADMGGAGYVFTGVNDANIMHNSAQINLNVVLLAEKHKSRVFYTSSACMYPLYNQEDPDNPNCAEDSAYPANPDSEYGWEKLFSERLYLAFARNTGLEIRIARLHNIFGPYGTFDGGKEKAPAAFCRKAIKSDGEFEVWGDGLQTRSFLYIDECIEGIMQLMASDFPGPVNIGSEEMVSINELARMVIEISGKDLKIKNVETNAEGVRGRNSDNKLILEKLGWAPQMPLIDGLKNTYKWVSSELNK